MSQLWSDQLRKVQTARSVSQAVKNKEPVIKCRINSEKKVILFRICASLSCMRLIAYAGFLRFSELINFKRSNICIFNSHVSKQDGYIQRRKYCGYFEDS